MSLLERVTRDSQLRTELLEILTSIHGTSDPAQLFEPLGRPFAAKKSRQIGPSNDPAAADQEMAEPSGQQAPPGGLRNVGIAYRKATHEDPPPHAMNVK